MNPVRPTSSFTNPKSKKQLKNRVKAQQGQSSTNNTNSNSDQNNSATVEKEKGSPVKEFQDYAGIGSDSIKIYAEQTTDEQLTEDAYNVLTEDINYKLRYIIHDCLVKSKLQGRETITSDDIDETFSNLNIDKVYGAPSSPNWVPFRDDFDTFYCLDDQKINLIDIAEKEFRASQEGDSILDQVWLTDGKNGDEVSNEHAETFSEYFETMCEAVISANEEIQHLALVDISTNPSIGPITDWFYHFSYFLLVKDLTYDHLTMRALQLLEVLENSPLPSVHVYGKQLQLLVRLLLQRLLKSTSKDPVGHMCYVLSLFCLRPPLKHLILNKVEDKLTSVCEEMAIPLLNIMYYLGIDAVDRLFLPNILYFLIRVYLEYNPTMIEIILAIYGLLNKAGRNSDFIYEGFREVFDHMIIPYCRPKRMLSELETSGEIKSATCTCPRGIKCHHIATLALFGHYNIAVTDKECSWNAPVKSTVEQAHVCSAEELYPPRPYTAVEGGVPEESIRQLKQDLVALGNTVGFTWLLNEETTTPRCNFPLIEEIISSKEFLEATDKASLFKEKCMIDGQLICDIAAATTGQVSNEKWYLARKFRLTASNFGLIISACKRNRFPDSLFKTLLVNRKQDIDVVAVRKRLIKTRRKVTYKPTNSRSTTSELSDIFEITPHCCDIQKHHIGGEVDDFFPDKVDGGLSFSVNWRCCNLRRKIENSRKNYQTANKDVTLGKTNLLLSTFKRAKRKTCYDHSLLSWCL